MFQSNETSKIYKYLSYAKLNLSLYVGCPNSDGLHPISSIFQLIDLADEITLTKTDDLTRISFYGQDVPIVNTCSKIINLISDRLQNNWDIAIHKFIPSGAGLGGGSSNAATLLLALNELENLNLSVSEMESIAHQVGSDVVFFLHGGLCHVQNVGEIINRVNYSSSFDYYILILPNIHMSTAKVYETLDQFDQFDLVNEFLDLDLMSFGYNRLQESAFYLDLKLSSLHQSIEKIVPNSVFMSGSGSTLYIPCESLNIQHSMFDTLTTKFPHINCLKVESMFNYLT